MSEQLVVQPAVSILDLPFGPGEVVFADARSILHFIDGNITEFSGSDTILSFTTIDGSGLTFSEAPCTLHVDEVTDDVSITQENTLLELGPVGDTLFSGSISSLQFINDKGDVSLFIGTEILDISPLQNGGLIAEEIHAELVDIGGGSGGASSTFVWNEALAGIIDGINPTFTLSIQPSSPSAIMIHNNGLLLKLGASKDFTYTPPNTVTFTAGAIPIPGDELEVSYQVT